MMEEEHSGWRVKLSLNPQAADAENPPSFSTPLPAKQSAGNSAPSIDIITGVIPRADSGPPTNGHGDRTDFFAKFDWKLSF